MFVQANSTYIASYHTDSGNYSDDETFFASSGFTSGQLTALSDNAAAAMASMPTEGGYLPDEDIQLQQLLGRRAVCAGKLACSESTEGNTAEGLCAGVQSAREHRTERPAQARQ